MVEWEHCYKIFSNQAHLNYHISKKVCHKPNRLCPKCGKRFSSKRNCTYHISQRVCDKDKPKLTLKTRFKYDELSRADLILKLSEFEDKYEILKNNNIIVCPKMFGKRGWSFTNWVILRCPWLKYRSSSEENWKSPKKSVWKLPEKDVGTMVHDILVSSVDTPVSNDDLPMDEELGQGISDQGLGRFEWRFGFILYGVSPLKTRVSGGWYPLQSRDH